MTPGELRRLLTLLEARRTRDLALLDAALAEDRRLAAEIAELAATGERDAAEGCLPPMQQGLRLLWADRRIAAAQLRRAALVPELARLRAAAAQSLGKHRALEHVLERAVSAERLLRSARAEREAPPPAGDDGQGADRPGGLTSACSVAAGRSSPNWNAIMSVVPQPGPEMRIVPDGVSLSIARGAGAIAVSVSACAPVDMNRVARPSVVDVVDVATTYKAVKDGAVEANPLVNALSDGTPLETAASSLLLKIASRAFLTAVTGSESCARVATNTVSAVGAVNNALALNGVVHPVSGAIGIAVAFALYAHDPGDCPFRLPPHRQQLVPVADDD